MDWLQIRPLGPYFSSFSTNSYGYYSQMSQNLISNNQVFASVLIVRQTAKQSASKDSSLVKRLQQVCDRIVHREFSRQERGGYNAVLVWGDEPLSWVRPGNIDANRLKSVPG